MVAKLFRFVGRFTRVKIEDSSLNRFALNGIQRDFSGGFYPVTINNISNQQYLTAQKRK